MRSGAVAPWCSGYNYCTTSFNKAWIQVLCWFKSCSRRVVYTRWRISLTMVPAGNKGERLSLVNHTTKTIHHHHHHHHHHYHHHHYQVFKNTYLEKYLRSAASENLSSAAILIFDYLEIAVYWKRPNNVFLKHLQNP